LLLPRSHSSTRAIRATIRIDSISWLKNVQADCHEVAAIFGNMLTRAQFQGAKYGGRSYRSSEKVKNLPALPDTNFFRNFPGGITELLQKPFFPHATVGS
jgi:hypothetical protein